LISLYLEQPQINLLNNMQRRDVLVHFASSMELAPDSSKQLCVCLKDFNGWMHERTYAYSILVYFLFGNFDFWIKLCWLMDSVIQLFGTVTVCASQPCRRNSVDLLLYASFGTDSNCTN